MEYASQASFIKAKSVGANVVEGINEGIDSKRGKMGRTMSSLANSMLDDMKAATALDMHSPSKRAKKEIGEQFKGVIEGVTSKKENAKKSVTELSELILEAAKTKLENYKVYNDLSLQEEIEYWGKIRKECKKGTQARIEADKEYYSIKKTLKENNDTLFATQNNTEDEYYANCKKVQLDLIESTKDLTKSYEDAVDARTKSISSSLNLFDAFASKQDVSGTELLGNLKSQVVGIVDWRKSLGELKGKGVSGGLLKELQEMGVDASGEIKALNSLTDVQLNEYVTLWNEKTSLAKDQAIDELVGLKEETSTKIQRVKYTSKQRPCKLLQRFTKRP